VKLGGEGGSRDGDHRAARKLANDQGKGLKVGENWGYLKSGLGQKRKIKKVNSVEKGRSASTRVCRVNIQLGTKKKGFQR